MSLKEFIYKTEFKDLKDRINLIQKDIDDTSFNIFKITTQHSHKENFHSDVIALLLSKTGRHYAGDLYMFLFIDLLKRNGADINKQNYFDVEIIVENHTLSLGSRGRIDVLIRDNRSKHCIIIENKMNNAGDTVNQLEKYYTYLIDKNYIVDSIIYLPLNDQKKAPNTYNKTINKLIINIPAYANDPFDLYQGWLLPCYQADVNQSANSFIYEYSKLVKHLSKMGLDKALKNEFYDILSEKDSMDRVTAILQLNSAIEEHRANLFMDSLVKEYEPFKKIYRYKPHHCLFFACYENNVEYKLDVQFFRDMVRVDLWNPNINDILKITDDQARTIFKDQMIKFDLIGDFDDMGFGNGMCRKFYVAADVSIKDVDRNVRNYVQVVFEKIKSGLNTD